MLPTLLFIHCATKSSIEAQFQHVYTHAKFKEVQAQFRGKINCTAGVMHRVFGIVSYEVQEQVSRDILN
ncbi:hypothetical protein PIB30_094886, partial [Stylosanthes scabra]|nr:hypothetical protein [Stylosanthes scabra]